MWRHMNIMAFEIIGKLELFLKQIALANVKNTAKDLHYWLFVLKYTNNWFPT